MKDGAETPGHRKEGRSRWLVALLAGVDNPRNGPRVVVSLASLVVAGLWLSIGLHIHEQRTAIFSSAEQELRGASFALSSHVRRTIEAVHTTLRSVDSWLYESSLRSQPADLNDLVELISQLQKSNEEPVDIRPIDNHGFLFRFSGADNFRVFVGDRPYVRELEAAPAGTLYISEPLVSRDSGRRVLPIAIRTHPNRYGIGYLVAAVTTAQFEAAFRELLISAPGRIGIVRSDGVSLAAVPDDDSLATPQGQAFLRRLLSAQRPAPTITRLPSWHTDTEAIVVALRLARQPALVYAAFDTADLDQRWRAEALPQVVGGAIATLVLVLISLWLLHLMRLKARETEVTKMALADANAANVAKRQFLANMSHELRTPLNAILGFSEIISSAIFGPLDAHYRSYGGDISKSGRHLLHLVDQLLDISRIESGQLNLQPQPNNLEDVFAEVLKVTLGARGERDITTTVNCDPAARILTADRGVLRQILINLLSNAVKFNRPGGSIDLRATNSDGAVEITIADTGCGIAPEDVAQIFEPFKKGDAHLAQKPAEGLGLGLPIVRELVRACGGSIEISSTLGEGTTVTLVLPQPQQAVSASA